MRSYIKGAHSSWGKNVCCNACIICIACYHEKCRYFEGDGWKIIQDFESNKRNHGLGKKEKKKDVLDMIHRFIVVILEALKQTKCVEKLFLIAY